MIKYIEGDIFSSPAQVIVIPVNTVGVMGKGLLLAFKKRQPMMFEVYRTICKKHLLAPGRLMLFRGAEHRYLLFPAKEDWHRPSRIEYLEQGLQKFAETYKDKGITSAAFPMLGCGSGGLSWDDVRPVMERYLECLPIAIYIYMGRG